MKTTISLFFILAVGVSELGGVNLKCHTKDAEEWKERWDHTKWVHDGFVYVYVNGKINCPDGSDPPGVVELWEWDAPENADDKAIGGWCGFSSKIEMNLFEVDGYVRDGRNNFLKFWESGAPEPYLRISATCAKNQTYEVDWFLGCENEQGSTKRRRSRETYIFENYLTYLVQAQNGKPHNQRACD